jgi:hypothetical protein
MRKMRARSLLVEELVANKEIIEEKEDIEIATGKPQKIYAKRFTFFSCDAATPRDDIADIHIIGYAVLVIVTPGKTAPLQYILESVVRPPCHYHSPDSVSPVANYYIHCFRDFTTTIGTQKGQKNFTFPGTFFCQQNGITHVCGHAALRIAFNTLLPQYGQAKVTSREINTVLGINEAEKGRSAQDGISVNQIIAFIKSRNMHPAVGDFDKQPQMPYEEFVYPIIESAHPVILSITNQKIAHVVTLLGHTLNSDRWAEAYNGYGHQGLLAMPQYISASAWTDHFIESDDNYGMYNTLPSEQVRNVLTPKYNACLHADVAIGIMPQNAILSGLAAEFRGHAGFAFLRAALGKFPPNKWRAVLDRAAQAKNLVLRTLLCDKTRYMASIGQAKDEKGRSCTKNELAKISTLLPNIFWVTELSITDLYTANKHKLGDLITRSDVPEGDGSIELRICGWIPGAFAYVTASGGVSLSEFSLQGHIPVLRNCWNFDPIREW